MTLVVSMSANTAAYAAQAIKPSAQIVGDQATDDAVTFSAVKTLSPPPLAPVEQKSWMSLLLLNSHGRRPMTPYNEVLKAYEDIVEEEPEPDSAEDDAPDDSNGDQASTRDPQALLALPPPDDVLSDFI